MFSQRSRDIGTALAVGAGACAASLILFWRPREIVLRGPCIGISLGMVPAAVLLGITWRRAPDDNERRFWGWWFVGVVALIFAEAAFGVGVNPMTGAVAPYVTLGVVAAVTLANGALVTSLTAVADRATIRVDVLTGLIGMVAVWACTSLGLVELAPRRGAPAAWLLGAAIATTPGSIYLDSRTFHRIADERRRSMWLARGFAVSLLVYLVISIIGVANGRPGFEPLTAPFVAFAVVCLTLMPLRHEYPSRTTASASATGVDRRHPAFVLVPIGALLVLAAWVLQRPHHTHLLAPLIAYLVAMCVLLALQGVVSAGESEMLRDELHHLATHDELTGLWNRRQGQLLLADALEQMPVHRGSGVGVVVIDLDGFKDLNDRQGHAAGDQRLRQVASALRGATRDGDWVCRLGGDEFVVVCNDVIDSIDARAAAQRLIDAVREAGHRHRVDGAFGSTGAMPGAASAGVVFIEDWVPPSVALAAADEALLTAKRSGRDQVALGQLPPRPWQ